MQSDEQASPMKFCQDCGNPTKPRADICVHCGRPTKVGLQQRTFRIVMFILILYGVFLGQPIF